MVWNRLKRLVSLCLILGFLISLCCVKTQAQAGAGEWSQPLSLSGYPDTTWYITQTGQVPEPPEAGAEWPAILSDPDGGLHVLWTDRGEPGQGADILIYRHWDGKSWSKPIRVAAIGDADGIAAVTLDVKGVLHVLWRSKGVIHYSRAVARDAVSPDAWQSPAFLFTSTGYGVYPCDIVADPAGVLHAVYVDRPDADGGIFYSQSSDGGDTWSKSVLASGTRPGPDLQLANLRLAVDGKGDLHLVWDQYLLPTGWPPMGVLYTRSSDKGQTWSEPVEIAGEGYGFPNIAAFGDNIYIAWNGTVVDDAKVYIGKYVQHSEDGGQRWTPPQKLFDIGGLTSGRPAMAFDHVGGLHLALFGGTPRFKPERSHISHTSWDGTSWSEPELLSGGMYGDFPAIVVDQDDRVHVVWSDIVNVWYAVKQLAAPALTSTMAIESEVREPVNLSNTPGDMGRPGDSRFPAIAADSSGGLHVFWEEQLETEPGEALRKPIFYSHWDGQKWSEPIYVLSDGLGDFPAVTVDSNDILHVTWKAGGGGSLCYSRAPAYDAMKVSAWTPPVFLAPTIYQSDIVADRTGTLHVAYSAAGEALDVYYLSSSDGGNTWSRPVNVSNSAAMAPEGFSNVRLAIDGRGRIHVVWAHHLAWWGISVNYARSLDGGQTWSEPLVVAMKEESDYQVDWINVAAVREDEIHLVWNKGRSPFRWHQWSSDGGETWTRPERLFAPLQSETGWTDMAVDSAGNLHLVTALYHGEEKMPAGPYWIYWDGSRWSDMVLITGDHHAAHHPRIAISEGNALNIVWQDNEPPRDIFFAMRRTSAPYVPPRSLRTTMPTPASTPTVEPSATSESMLTPASTITPPPGVSTPFTGVSSISEGGLSTSPSFPIVVGIVPTALLILVVIVAQTTWRRR